MKTRIPGFDMARAYAIFGMIIVHFNMVFGDYTDSTALGSLLFMFSGNSAVIFIILAGMGISLMGSGKANSVEEKNDFRKGILKKSVFLFFGGLIFSLWWPADILHMYGIYMAIAAMLLFVNSRVYLILAAIVVIFFHWLYLMFPYETGWNFENFKYVDFYTWEGFLRNTFFNGWNPLFPWMAFFLVGMYLGRLDWKNAKVQARYFLLGTAVYLCVIFLEMLSYRLDLSEGWMIFIHANYLPPLLPFFLGTASFALMIISVFMFVGEKTGDSDFVKSIAQTGQLTFTHYISHITLGILLLCLITGKSFDENIFLEEPNSPLFVLTSATIYFLICMIFSAFWLKRYRKGPMETLMRKFSDPGTKKSELPQIYYSETWGTK